MTSPKQIHDADQALAWGRNLGAAFGLFYEALIEKGVPADHARDITVEYVAGFVGAMRKPPTDDGKAGG